MALRPGVVGLKASDIRLAESGEPVNGEKPIFRSHGMQLRGISERERKRRFEGFKVVFPILLAGWIPSVLTLIVSYTILRDTTETRILRHRQKMIHLIRHKLRHDLTRSS